MRNLAIFLLGLVALSAYAQQINIAELQERASKGDAVAQRQLGQAYEDGKGVKQDDWEAAAWYKKAAEVGDAEAQNDLGLLYRQGRGVPYDKAIATQWYAKAARQKFSPAMFNLATAYYNGDGVQTDYGRAYAWFLLAQQEGNEAAADGVQRLEHDLTKYRVVGTHYQIAGMFAVGDELPQDPALAFRWYQRAFDEGWAPAGINIASLYLRGWGVPQDPALATEWCKKAGTAGDPEGFYCLGNYSEDGLGGLPKDDQKALQYYTEAAFLGSYRAMYVLGSWYAAGTKVKKDDFVAFAWLAICAGVVPGARAEFLQVERRFGKPELKAALKRRSELLREMSRRRALVFWKDRLMGATGTAAAPRYSAPH